MFKTIEGNFENSDVNELLKKHFVELRAASPEGSAHVLDIEGLKVPSIKFWSLWDDDNPYRDFLSDFHEGLGPTLAPCFFGN